MCSGLVFQCWLVIQRSLISVTMSALQIELFRRGQFSGAPQFCNLAAWESWPSRAPWPDRGDRTAPFSLLTLFRHIWVFPEHRPEAAVGSRAERVNLSVVLFLPLSSKVCWQWVAPLHRGSIWGPNKSSASFDRVYGDVFLIILDVLPIIPLASSEDRDK